jgi:hypothetical protein
MASISRDIEDMLAAFVEAMDAESAALLLEEYAEQQAETMGRIGEEGPDYTDYDEYDARSVYDDDVDVDSAYDTIREDFEEENVEDERFTNKGSL